MVEESYEKIRILVAESFELVRIGLRSLFESHPSIHLVAETNSIEHLFKLATQLRSCLETPVLSQSPQHNTSHSDVNPSFIGARKTFVAFTEAA